MGRMRDPITRFDCRLATSRPRLENKHLSDVEYMAMQDSLETGDRRRGLSQAHLDRFL